MERAGLLRGAKEIAIVALGYGAYSLVRNLMGDDAAVAELNAHRIIDWERSLGIFHERTVQQWLDAPSVIRPLNTFYALAHFFVTGALMIWLYFRRRDTPAGNRYARWRNAILVTCGLALLGYALFPLMPPRLVDGIGIRDTLEVFGAPWTYQGEAAKSLSNQYAAMPSLHIAWAMWCSIVIWKEGPGVGRHATGWSRTAIRAAAVLYSFAAWVAVVATGNHYFLDGVGGALVLAAGITATWGSGRPAARPADEAADEEVPLDDRLPSAATGSEAVVPAVDGDDVAGVVAARTAGQVDGEAPEVGG